MIETFEIKNTKNSKIIIETPIPYKFCFITDTLNIRAVNAKIFLTKGVSLNTGIIFPLTNK